MSEKQIKVSTLKLLKGNPRQIKDEKFAKLVKSISEFPHMMELRPIVVDENNVVLGGNMRLRAITELGMKTIPENWVKVATGLSEEEKKQFTIKDNVVFGGWDFDILANEWENKTLIDWGVDVWDFSDVKNAEDITTNNQEYKSTDDLAMEYLNNDMKKFEIYIEKKDYENFIKQITIIKHALQVETNSDAMLQLVLNYK